LEDHGLALDYFSNEVVADVDVLELRCGHVVGCHCLANIVVFGHYCGSRRSMVEIGKELSEENDLLQCNTHCHVLCLNNRECDCGMKFAPTYHRPPAHYD